MADQQPELSYEQAYALLEETLAALESGELPLEQALQLYEQGAKLAAHCAALLDAAELRVRQWQPGDTTTPFADWQET
jgi:exodeoxyribonuclease VII small subunit